MSRRIACCWWSGGWRIFSTTRRWRRSDARIASKGVPPSEVLSDGACRPALVARKLNPDVALAVVCPSVAAMWHPTLNENLTPTDLAATSGQRAFFICPAGHVSHDIVATRTSIKAAWKGGDPAACKRCLGFELEHVFDCGHRVVVQPQQSENDDCPGCRRAAWEERERIWQDRRRAGQIAFRAARARAEELLAEVIEPNEPRPLIVAWRTESLKALQAAIANEEVHGKADALQHAVDVLKSRRGLLQPDEKKLARAVELREPVSLFNTGHWARGWQHHLCLVECEPVAPDDADALRCVDQIGVTLRSEFDALARGAQCDDWRPSVAQATRALTEALASWAYDHNWRPYRELKLPIAPEAAARFGRCDLIVLRGASPDVVIELDSAPNAASEVKLRFVAEAGAIAVWVRWRAGAVATPEGVHVVDLVELSRHLV